MEQQGKIVMFSPLVADSAISRVESVLRGRWVGQGQLVDEFERAVETTLGARHAVAVNCSSSALRLALDLCGVGPGDEVVTTPLTCTLTNHPILEQFARPVFADIQPDTGNIDPNDVARRITKLTKAIVCTHWGGYPCDLDELNRVAADHGLPVIEDASEAFGATYRGKPVGGVSRFTAFSFQAIQLITTGEGGMLMARNESDGDAARLKRWYGISRRNRKTNTIGYYDFDISTVGFGYHLTNIAAAIGLGNLATLPEQRTRRAEISARYQRELANTDGLRLLRRDLDREPSNHFFTVLVERRDEFCRMMKDRGIEVSVVHYRNDEYSVFGGRRTGLPGLEEFSQSYIALPLHLHLSDQDVDHVCSSIQAGW